MSYLNVVNAIRSAANTVNPDGSFHNGRKVDFSQESIVNSFPAICLYPFVISPPQAGGFIDSSDILMGFFAQDDPASSMSERENLINEMDQLVTAFMAALRYQFRKFSAPEPRREPVYQFFNGTVSGILIQFNYLTFAEGDCVARTGFGDETVDSAAQTFSIVFDAKPGARYVPSLDTVPDWLIIPDDVLQYINGVMYAFSVLENLDPEDREAIILFTSVDDPQVLSLTITQEAPEI